MIFCHFGFHKWGKWYLDNKGELKRQDMVIGLVEIQKRNCERCNKLEMNIQKVAVSDVF